MAQITEKEETEFEVAPETISLCVKCGVSSSSAANNLCQKCFSATETPSVSAVSSTVAKPLNHAFVKKPYISISTNLSFPDRNLDSAGTSGDLNHEALPPVEREVNRCSGCRRKVGLTGFRCRCGELFCADHRYSDRHDCTYDYKSAGREAIARDNPVVKVSKIVRI